MPPENLGARMVEEVTVDVTSLTNAGNEPLSTWTSESGIDVVQNFQVVGQENGQYLITPDHLNDQVTVKEVNDTGDGTGGVADVASTTDIGEVKLRLEGRR